MIIVFSLQNGIVDRDRPKQLCQLRHSDLFRSSMTQNVSMRGGLDMNISHHSIQNISIDILRDVPVVDGHGVPIVTFIIFGMFKDSRKLPVLFSIRRIYALPFPFDSHSVGWINACIPLRFHK